MPANTTGPGDAERHDVIVLGSGLIASILAAALARQGIGVVLVDGPTDGRLVRGEMLTPPAPVLLRTIAARYGLPEVAHLASFDELSEATGPSSGRERCHSFLYHRAGRPLDPSEVLQLNPPDVPPEPNLYRPDVDAYLLRTALAHGARAVLDSPVRGVEVRRDGVLLTTGSGRRLLGGYLVDASDRDSPFVAALGLREEPTGLRLRTRSLYTHMSGLTEVGSVYGGPSFAPPRPWEEGSVHHVFAGGHLSVYGFGNHPRATHGLSAVCLTLDVDRHPRGESPEAEFSAFLDAYPSVAPLFAAAKPEAPWEATGRQQYSSARTVGERWCVIGEAAGYVDPFFNRGLITGLEQANGLAWRLIEAARAGHFGRDRFAPLERMGRELLAAQDGLVSMMLASTHEHITWRTALSLLETGLRFGQFVPAGAVGALLGTGSDAELRKLEEIDHYGSVFPGHHGYNELLATAREEFTAAAAGERDPGETAAGVLARLRGADFVPDFFVLDTVDRFPPQLGPADILRLEEWARNGAPADVAAIALSAVATVRGRMAAQG
ncbi:hypothetical protein [Streptomyces hoynatensis]|uniref:FAD-dependent oxidoreductase n=1 Tax=Streptomyces hoynatensis TaxID=1141874 RepID=A0A3A9Z9D6_9ACTN|nr:hypothetical protein [Streptomyces hoynatensis]RKN43916.1 hypothetical protein D7294_09515 [Streptomyces hoynatensis]